MAPLITIVFSPGLSVGKFPYILFRILLPSAFKHSINLEFKITLSFTSLIVTSSELFISIEIFPFPSISNVGSASKSPEI